MITKQDLQQTGLFDKFNMVLSPKIREKLDKRWEGIFREVILELMPVDEMGKRFCPNNGRPTQELYAMCGLILMKNFFGWSIDETLMKYSCDLSVQYALNVQQEFCELGRSTFMRYLKDFQSKELAGELFEKITQRIISKLNINLELQRLDSTHVCSNMASWGRNQLMFNIIKRFLIQLKRHESKLYHNLDKELINRYSSDGNWIFASPNSQDNSKRVHISSNRERLAWDMLKLLESFEKHPKISNMNTFKNLHRVFSEQCEMIDNKVVVKKHPGGDIMINPSDPDATCGHKGDGYQVQVMETYSKDNDVQIVTTVLPQKANASDQKSVTTVVELAKEQDVTPQKILADAGYGADENVETLKKSNIELVAPVLKNTQKKFTLENFEFDADNHIVKCPCDHKPFCTKYYEKSGKYKALFRLEVCENCPLQKDCIAQKNKYNRFVEYTQKNIRLRNRLLYEQTEEFKTEYRPRSGIEGLFGRLKQTTDLRRLRIRGKESVNNAIYLIMAGHNIAQVVKFIKEFKKLLPIMIALGLISINTPRYSVKLMTIMIFIATCGKKMSQCSVIKIFFGGSILCKSY